MDKINKKIAIQIVTWNSRSYLRTCFESIFNQTFKKFDLFIIDNASSDGTVDWIRSNYPGIAILQNSNNLGFSRAHNQGLKLHHSPYIVVMNPDIILDPNFLKTAANALTSRDKAAAVCGKLSRFHFSSSDLKEVVEDGIIDATGLVLMRNYQAYHRGAGEIDDGQFEKTEEVFGASGALAVYRRSALDTVAVAGKIFDDGLFAYKEDVDLAWRLRLAGWSTYFYPLARALHFREARDGLEHSNKALAQARKKKSSFVNYLSYRNHALVVIKNAYVKNILHNLPAIAWYELKKFVYIIIFEWQTIPAMFEILKSMPETLRQRKFIHRHARCNADDMRRWLK
jgi:GT2 family glycosyltransferase